MADAGLPLKRGAVGPSVRDLQLRLAEAGHPVEPAEDTFGDGTETAVRSFQESRGIEVDGSCGRHTWAALIEAAHRLGNRLLYLQSPMLRGDDVAELQQRLGALGFDAGRVDSIFGPDTAAALTQFQRNAGLPTDAIFGPDSLAALQRLGGRDNQANVASVRERERLLNLARPGERRRVVLGEFGGLGTVVDTMSRQLRAAGATLTAVAHPDGSHHARLCNEIEADLYLGLVSDHRVGCSVSYFSSNGFESAGGAHLAALLAQTFEPIVVGDVDVKGRRLAVLRETRMPAVVIRVGPTSSLVERAPQLAQALADAVTEWLESPVAQAPDPA